MDLIIDNNFKESYELYYGSLRDKIILVSINKMFALYDPELITDAVNIIKTAMTLGLTYTECYDKISSKILYKFPLHDDIDKFILSLVVKIMVAAGCSDINKLLKSTRDIIGEATAKHYRIPLKKVTQEMIESILEASDRFYKDSYSVFDQPTDGWDQYFYNVSRQVARNSKCFSRKIGAVLVNDKSIISTGYNGPPRGIPRCDMRWALDEDFMDKYGKHTIDKDIVGRCPRHVVGFGSGEGLEMCIAGHAERNALINAARNGIKTKGTSLYMTCALPCTPCIIEIINAGVKEIIVASLTTYDDTSMYLLKQSDLGVRLFDFID